MKFLLALLCLLCALGRLSAAPAVVVVLLPPASLPGWQAADAPVLHRLMRTGALAVMNTRTAHQAGRQDRETVQGVLLTLGAGSRAAGTSPDSRFLPASSPTPGMASVRADALFRRRTGTAVQPGRSVCLDWPGVLAANRDPGYDLRLGSLAETLNSHGVSIAAGRGGDADWLAADGDGAVQHVPELRAAPGLCLIWDAGPDIRSADKVLANAAGQMSALRGVLIVLSPSASSRQLAPALVWGPDIPAGLLVSPSTRRAGLVTDTDFAPSVAACFGIPRTAFRSPPFGFAWSAQASPNALGVCERLNTEAERQAGGMRLLPYLAAALSLWILAATLAAFRVALPGGVVLAPAAALTAALFGVSMLSFGLLLVALLGVFFFLARVASPARLLTFLCCGLTAALCVDMVTGNTLMHRGLLGYSALEGARYYGLGNEAMGLLLSAVLVAASRLWQPNKPSRFILLLTMAGIVLLLGPAGAKAGGVLVSLAVFGGFLFSLGGRRWTAKAGALFAAIVLAGITAAAVGDAFLSAGTHSHIGEAVRRITAGGPGEAWDIVRRKLAVEGRLAYHSAWALLLWLGLLCTLRLWQSVPAANHRDRAMRLAGGIGIASCLLLNDAGVVAAAIFTTLLWSAAILQEKSLSVLDVSRTKRH